MQYILVGGRAVDMYISRLPIEDIKRIRLYRPPSESNGDVDLVDPNAQIKNGFKYLSYFKNIDPEAYLDFTVHEERMRAQMLNIVPEIKFDPYPVIALPNYNAEVFLGQVGPVKVNPNDNVNLDTGITLGSGRIDKVAALDALAATQLNPVAVTDNRITKIVIAALSYYLANTYATKDSKQSEEDLASKFESAGSRIQKGADDIDGIVEEAKSLIDYEYLRGIHPNTIISFALQQNTSDAYKDGIRKLTNRIKNRENKLISIVNKAHPDAVPAIKRGLDVLIETLQA